jgi:hypothetical protein
MLTLTVSISCIPTAYTSFNNTVYVAAVWNTYRKNRLMILDVIVRCSKRLEIGNNYHDEKYQIDELIADLMAGIPFHLAENFASFVEQAHGSLELTIVPGRSVGGLLLMHPLFVISHLSIVGSQFQTQMRDCLAWIGNHMGIGEATMLSSVRKLNARI